MKCPGRDQMEALLAAMACAQRWGLVGSLGGVGQHLHSSKCISSYGGNAGREVVVVGGKGAWAALMAMDGGPWKLLLDGEQGHDDSDGV